MSHLTSEIIEQIAIGADVGDEAVAHVSACDACAEALAKEARLELALGELHAFVAGTRHVPAPSNVRLFVAPILVLAAAAAVFFVLHWRGPTPSHEVRSDPSVAVGAPAVGSPVAPSSGPAEPRADIEGVIAKLRPQMKKCFKDSMGDASGEGSLVLVVSVAADGSVTDVAAVDRKGAVSDSSVACFVALLKAARFATGDKPTTVRVPVSFVVNH